CITARDSEAALGVLTGRTHVAFQAASRSMVEAAYAAALAHGGRDNGAPGLRTYHLDYFAAFVLDPDGNNIEFVVHGVAERSADSVTITFEGWGLGWSLSRSWLLLLAPVAARPSAGRQAGGRGQMGRGGTDWP